MPNDDPIALVMQNKDALGRMPEGKAIKFVDMLFRKYMLPKYQKVNKQFPLDEEEKQSLRLHFAGTLLGIPTDDVQLKGPKPEYGMLSKAGAALEAGGAGVLGGIRTISELAAKFDKTDLSKDSVHRIISEAEKKAYEDAQGVSPSIASGAAAVGHQIPAAIAAEGVGGMIPKVGAGAPAAAKIAVGGARGAAEGGAFEAARPGGDAQKGAMWGGVLGTAFPLMGKLFGFGAGKASSAAKEAVPATPTATTVSSGAASEAPKNMGDIAELAAQKKFKKSFKDLSSTEKTQIPSAIREEIKSQQAARIKVKADEKAALRAKKEEAAKATVKKDAAKRRAEPIPTPTSEAREAVAKQAVQENPSIGKTVGATEGFTSPTSEIREVPKPGVRDPELPIKPSAKTQAQLDSDANSLYGKSYNELTNDEKKEVIRVTGRVPEVATGKKVRAKEGKPASPAQQASDRERQAKVRETAKKEEFGAALEKHAQQMAGRYTASSLNLMHLPEIEDAARELPGGNVILSAAQKMKKKYSWNDDTYMGVIKEWLEKQFSEEAPK